MSDVGRYFAYRDRVHTPGDPVRPVELVREGPPRSQKVKIRWLDGEYEGTSEVGEGLVNVCPVLVAGGEPPIAGVSRFQSAVPPYGLPELLPGTPASSKAITLASMLSQTIAIIRSLLMGLPTWSV
jgi:hypothetical protein